MRGRELFVRFRFLLELISKSMIILPVFLLKWLWSLSDLMPDIVGVAYRYCILKRLAKNVGDNVFIGRGVSIHNWERLCIGSNVSIHNNCYLDAYGGIKIGDNVSIAHQTSIISFEHTWKDKGIPIRDNPLDGRSIEIYNDVWIGAGSRLLAGIEIKNRVIVGAGSVVTKSIQERVIVGGVPAKIIKTI